MTTEVSPISLETVTTEVTGLAPDAGNDRIRTLGDTALDGLGQLSVSPAVPGASVVASNLTLINNSSARVTIRTPAAGLRIRVISAAVQYGGVTVLSAEIYFGIGANVDSDGTKAVLSANVDVDTNSLPMMVWPDGGGPVGLVEEVLSVRCSVAIANNCRFILQVREE